MYIQLIFIYILHNRGTQFPKKSPNNVELETITTSLEASLSPIVSGHLKCCTGLAQPKDNSHGNTLSVHSDELNKLTLRLVKLKKADVVLASKAEDLENQSSVRI